MDSVSLKYRDLPHVISVIYNDNGDSLLFTKEGLYHDLPNGECLLFPSKDQRCWSKFKCPNPKKPRFDPKTLQPFDKMLIRWRKDIRWAIEHFGFLNKDNCVVCASGVQWQYAVPYNDETKHLLGTSEEAPEYYRYWKD